VREQQIIKLSKTSISTFHQTNALFKVLQQK
jgi:hypothetical protein